MVDWRAKRGRERGETRKAKERGRRRKRKRKRGVIRGRGMMIQEDDAPSSVRMCQNV